MEQDIIFNQKKEIARNTIHVKQEIHGFKCEVYEADECLTPYGEESGHSLFLEPVEKRLLIVRSTQENMHASEGDILNSTENSDLFLRVFEDDIYPRGSKIKVYMHDGKYKQLEIRDNVKNEGTYVIHQQLVPLNNTVEDTDYNAGLNIPEEPEVEYCDDEGVQESEGLVSSRPLGNNL